MGAAGIDGKVFSRLAYLLFRMELVLALSLFV